MGNLLTYILQVNLLLVIVYLGYYFLLRKLTFYSLNRVYFLISSVYAFVYPLIDLKRLLVEDTAVRIPVLWDYISVEQVEQISKVYSLYDFLLGAIGLGAFVFVFRLLVQLISLARIHLYSRDSRWHHFLFRDVVFPVVPFSFFNRIYLHKAQHEELELQDIFEHESIHVKGHHTWDVLLFEIVLIGCWYNPFVWLMRNAVRQNLEYLTDQQVLNKGVDRQTYQYSLLNVTQLGAAVGVSNQFNFKILKKRIMMMNKKRSSHMELSKYAFLLPIMLLAGASFTVSQAESKMEEVVTIVKETPLNVVVPNSLEKFDDAIIVQDIAEKDGAILPVVADSVAYLLDDRLVEIDEIKKISPQDLESVVINKDNELTKKYKKKTIVNIKTKEFSGTVGTPSQFSAISFDKGELNLSGGSLSLNHKGQNIAGSADGITFKSQPYPLLAPDFDRKELEKGNFYFIIDDKLVSLDEFIGFPREEISGVDIYKDKTEIKRKIGKANADGLFVMTSKKPNTAASFSIQKSDEGIKRLKNKNEIHPGKSYLYEYDGDLITKEDFLKKSDDDLPYILLISDKQAVEGLYKNKVSNIHQYDGIIRAKSILGEKKSNEEANNILLIVDGVVKGRGSEILKNMNPNDIESMDVSKGQVAIDKFGDKGKDGVMEIKLKKQVEKDIKKFVEKEIDEERSR